MSDDLTPADRLARRRLTDALLTAHFEPDGRREERIAATLAAFDTAFPPAEPSADGRTTRRRWVALATAAGLAAAVGGMALFTPPTAAAAVRRLTDAARAAGPRRYDLTLTFADGSTRAGTVTVAGPSRFRADLAPVRPRGRGLAWGSDGRTSWVRGPRGAVRTFDRPAVWREDPAAAEYRVLPDTPAALLARLSADYDLSFGEPDGGVRPVVAVRRGGFGPDRVTVVPDATGERTARLVLEFAADGANRVRRVVLIDAGQADAAAAGAGPH